VNNINGDLKSPTTPPFETPTAPTPGNGLVRGAIVKIDRTPKVPGIPSAAPAQADEMVGNIPENTVADPDSQAAEANAEIVDVPEAATASFFTPGNNRRGGKKNNLDPAAVFKSSTTKLLVVRNKSAKKKQNGATPAAGAANAENTPAYAVTPVRRSTRKKTDGGYDKWNTYRTTTTIDSPSEIQDLGINKQDTAMKKNPFLNYEEDSD